MLESVGERTGLTRDPVALQAMLEAERAENERLRQIIKKLQRHRFGRRAESLPPDQLLLAIEEVEQTQAQQQASEEAVDAAKRESRTWQRRANRGSLPAHLARLNQTLDIADRTCPCCSGPLHLIGEDVSGRLDVVPAQFRVIVTHRPKYACRACEEVVVQMPAPARLVEGGIPTEATVAQGLVSKYADHLPLYRQAQIYARQGVTLDRSTLADWVGKAAFLLRPVHERLFERLKASSKLFADETTAPVLDPGRGRTKTGQLFAYARDDRPWRGTDLPGVAYLSSPDRKAEQPLRHLQGFAGILQFDGYAGYKKLAETNTVSLAYCWSHLWMPLLWQGVFVHFGIDLRLRSSIRPVVTTHPAPSALMVHPQARSQSRATSSRLDGSNGFVWPRCARSCHHARVCPRVRRPRSGNVRRTAVRLAATAARRRARHTAASPRSCAPSCWRLPPPQHWPAVAPSASRARASASPASA